MSNSNQRRRPNRNRPYRRRDGRHKQHNQFDHNDLPICPICEKTVRDVLTAIATGTENKPTHFDCVLKALGEQEPLEPNEKICYLGGGSFGIVKSRGGSAGNKFFVRKRLQYEPKEHKVSWRKKIADRFTIR